MTARHIIFDCDGVLVDSEPLSMRADVLLLREYGIHMTEQEAHRRFVGKTFQAMLDELAVELGIAISATLTGQKDDLIEAMYRKELQIVPGVAGMLDELQRSGLSFSIASNSPKRRVELALDLTNIADFFDAITTKEDVDRAKPAPDVYALAAQLSGFATTQCMAVEDSTTGVTAAVAANLKTVGFTGTHHEPAQHGRELSALGASHVITSMTDLIKLTR